jgi:hypothetical protein
MRIEVAKLRKEIIHMADQRSNFKGVASVEKSNGVGRIDKLFGEWDKNLLEIADRRLDIVELLPKDLKDGRTSELPVGGHGTMEPGLRKDMSNTNLSSAEVEEEEEEYEDTMKVDEEKNVTPQASSDETLEEALETQSSAFTQEKSIHDEVEMPSDELDDFDDDMELMYPEDSNLLGGDIEGLEKRAGRGEGSLPSNSILLSPLSHKPIRC